MNLDCFSYFYSLLSLLLIFIEHRSYRFSERKTNRNFHYREVSSSTNDYRGQHGISYYQPAKYNQRRQDRHDRATQQYPYISDYGR